MKQALESLRELLLNGKNEDANRPIAYILFRSLFGKEFAVESDAAGADGYVKGRLLIELKTDGGEWLSGLYQGLHYQKLGLSFPNICVLANRFLGLWKVANLPQAVLKLAAEADSQRSPSEIGRINANKTSKAIRTAILRANTFLLPKHDFSGLFAKDIDAAIKAFIYALRQLDRARIQINLYNFIDYIDLLRRFFDEPLDAIHCFYAIVGYWTVASKVITLEETGRLQVEDPSRNCASEAISVEYRHQEGFRRFIEQHYVFTNVGSGITADNYFSRFDEVITRLHSDYARQHGILFTDHNLSKFAMWFVHERFEKNLSEKYIVFDPAAGSGNLVTSLDWRGHLKHKIVSELQPDLLKVIERRMHMHEEQAGRYTIIPKTVDNKGLNFVDKSAAQYIAELKRVLTEKAFKIDKPFAFLLNPPYKNTDENVAAREQVKAEYVIDKSILELTGRDAGRERYLAFLGQIIRIAEHQNGQHPDFKPILMIFTPTSWLIPRPSYIPFRKEFDKHFQFINGFMITSNEFFKIKGKWPLTFTIWCYNYNEGGNSNRIRLWDYTHLRREDLATINWSARIGEIDKTIRTLIRKARSVKFHAKKQDIRTLLPHITDVKTGKAIQQPRYNFYRSKQRDEDGMIISGFPLTDTRHRRIAAPHGFTKGTFVGFMDDCTPVRLVQERYCRLSNDPDRIWLRLDNDFKSVNKAKIFSGPTDNRGYCAYDLKSAKATLTWFAIAKATSGRFPIWANQFDIWVPKIPRAMEDYFYSLCFALGLAENRCVVTRFEADNPIAGVPEVFVGNPLSTNNTDAFWYMFLDKHILSNPAPAMNLIASIKELYEHWARKYCGEGLILSVGLKDEPYFKYFHYNDFLTPDSGLVQIRKFAEINHKVDLLQKFEIISERTKKVRDEIYRVLVEDFKYFQ